MPDDETTEKEGKMEEPAFRNYAESFKGGSESVFVYGRLARFLERETQGLYGGRTLALCLSVSIKRGRHLGRFVEMIWELAGIV